MNRIQCKMLIIIIFIAINVIIIIIIVIIIIIIIVIIYSLINYSHRVLASSPNTCLHVLCILP